MGYDHRSQAGLSGRARRWNVLQGPADRLALALLAIGLSFAGPVLADRDHDQVRQLHRAGQILPLETIIATHRRQNPSGQLLEVELEKEQGRYVYELTMLGEDGVVREFRYDARSGELWRVERE